MKEIDAKNAHHPKEILDILIYGEERQCLERKNPRNVNAVVKLDADECNLAALCVEMN